MALAPEQKSQLPEYAFNIHSWATPIEAQEDYIYVQANDYTSVSWETEVKSCAAKEESAFHDAIEITLDEVIKDRDSAQKGRKPYLIVGIAYYKDGTLNHKAHEELSKKGAVGDVANQPLINISGARKLWVVVPVLQAAPINVQYFVLLHGEHNFRKPYPIRTEARGKYKERGVLSMVEEIIQVLERLKLT